MPQRLIDLLSMSRFANLPTVWSNAFLGILIGLGFFKKQAHLCPTCLTLIGLALSCLYLGGCFFNDWHDVKFDTKTRPDRPIPSGRWSRQTILIISLILLILGFSLTLIVSLPASIFAAGIIICILAYTKWHKSHSSSFLFMAGARALIYPTAAFSLINWQQFQTLGSELSPILVLPALSLGGYILGISLTAKAETSNTPEHHTKKILPILCLATPIIFTSLPFLATKSGHALIPFIIFLATIATTVRILRSNHNVGQFVSRALAAIPLVDLLMVVPIQPAHPILWTIPILLALLALGLQKIAPAT